jgi:hypothetical protein
MVYFAAPAGLALMVFYYYSSKRVFTELLNWKQNLFETFLKAMVGSGPEFDREYSESLHGSG